jgi:tyrosine-protein phosphatase YwqE
VVIQITAGSILGDFGRRAESAAQAIAEHTDWPVIIASDAHWSFERTPGDLKRAMEVVAKWIGSEEWALKMVTERPGALVG